MYVNLNLNTKVVYVTYTIILTTLVIRDLVDWKHNQLYTTPTER